MKGLLGDFGTAKVIEMVADVPIAEFGDTMKVEGVLVGDGTKRVVMYFPGERRKAAVWWEGELTLEETEAWLAQTDDPTEPVYRDNTKTVKAVVRKARRQLDQNVAWKVYQRAGYECEYCAATGVPLTYDHWLAQAFGGVTTLENGVSSCRPCNKAKGHKTKAEWVQYMIDRGYERADEWANRLHDEEG